MVVAAAGAHEHGLAAELARDHLEAEDPAVELGRPLGVADEQDGVVEAGDGDAHGASVPESEPQPCVRHRLGEPSGRLPATPSVPAALNAAAPVSLSRWCP